MKASELMIGDWVQHRDEFNEVTGPYEIDLISNDEIAFKGEVFARVFNNSIEPIPLAPEILEKNGFDVQSHENPAAFAYKKEDVSIAEVYWNGPERGYRCIFSYGDTRLRITCHFVHELQHAIQLCRIDKEIEL